MVGIGGLDVSCCDEESNEKLIHHYQKVCLGAAFDISTGVGYVSNSQGDSYKNPPRTLLGGEFGFWLLEGGAAVDTTTPSIEQRTSWNRLEAAPSSFISIFNCR